MAIEGDIQVDETGKRVTISIALSDAGAVQLWMLLDKYKRENDLPNPESTPPG